MNWKVVFIFLFLSFLGIGCLTNVSPDSKTGDPYLINEPMTFEATSDCTNIDILVDKVIVNSLVNGEISRISVTISPEDDYSPGIHTLAFDDCGSYVDWQFIMPSKSSNSNNEDDWEGGYSWEEQIRKAEEKRKS